MTKPADPVRIVGEKKTYSPDPKPTPKPKKGKRK